MVGLGLVSHCRPIALLGYPPYLSIHPKKLPKLYSYTTYTAPRKFMAEELGLGS